MIVPEDPRDLSLSHQHDETLGPLRQRDRLLNLRPYKTSVEIEIGIENTLIVLSRVALAHGDALAFGPRKPVLVNLWLGNGFGRTLAILASNYGNRPLLYGAVEYNGKRMSEEDLRTRILSILRCTNIIVGFQVGWNLVAALNNVLLGHRVVDLGTEQEFHYWCRHIQSRRTGWRNAFFEIMIN